MIGPNPDIIRTFLGEKNESLSYVSLLPKDLLSYLILPYVVGKLPTLENRLISEFQPPGYDFDENDYCQEIEIYNLFCKKILENDLFKKIETGLGVNKMIRISKLWYEPFINTLLEVAKTRKTIIEKCASSSLKKLKLKYSKDGKSEVLFFRHIAELPLNLSKQK